VRRLPQFALSLLVLAQCAVLGAEQPPAKTPDASVQAVDPRLSQKVTYEGGYKRLHQVIEDLSAQTGVTIRCGKDNADWAVRDLPLVICVRDMPLGKLLRLLAVTSHTTCSSYKARNQEENKRTYRLYWTAAQEKDVTSVLQKRRDAKLALADWSWDALAKLGQSPETVGGEKESRLLGKILATLGTDVKKRLLDGEQIAVRGRDCPQADDIHELYRWAWESMKSGMVTDPADITETELGRAVLDMCLQDPAGEENNTSISFSLSPITWKDGASEAGSGWLGRLQDQAPKGELAGKLELTPRPAEDGPPSPQDEMPDRTLQFLQYNHRDDWKRPSLPQNAKLERPNDKKDCTFADLMVAISKACHLDVICEDYQSQKHRFGGDSQDPDSFFGDKVDVGAALRRLDWGKTDWFINDEQKLLLGWADDWRDHHRHLVSASYLAGLRAKLRTNGVELDDITPFANMVWGQFAEWISQSRDLMMFSQSRPDVAWKLYDLLKPQDRAHARSEAGLPLFNFDPGDLAEFCHQQRLQNPYYGARPSDEPVRESIEQERQRRDRVLSDPKLVATLIMRVKSSPAKWRGVSRLIDGREQRRGEQPPEALGLRAYEMELQGVEDGNPFTIKVQGPGMAFPAYSPEREAEILKEKDGK
jgi:hypothetical protein